MTEDKYFDNAATTFPYYEALYTYLEAAILFPANPSATYKEGREAKTELEMNRALVASCLNISPANLFFTSGATESIAIVMSSFLQAKVPGKIILSPIEHEAVLSWCGILKEKGWTISYLKAKNGFVSPDELKDMLDSTVRLVAIQLVNNVVGAVQPIKECVNIVREKEKQFGRSIFFFSDAVQALGKIDFSLTDLDVDGASFSSHKIKGPRGIGALYLKKPLQVLAKGGGQEKGIRGGTENLAAVAGFREALELYIKEDRSKIEEINKALREFFNDKNIKVLSPEKNSSPYVLSISTPLPAEVLTRMLSDEGYCISAGSACSNNAKGKAENVIKAMGFNDKIATGTVRISFSPASKKEDAMNMAELIYKHIKDF